ncbi:MAG: hypothetical protein QM723_22330 [Myxococcaceae bacterium]
MKELRELLQRWRRISVRLDPTLDSEPWDRVPPDRFLRAFRPDGARLPDLFAGLPSMMPVLERVQQLFEWGGAGSGTYLHVSRPRALSDAELTQTVRRWINGVGALAEDLGITVGHQVRNFLADTSMRVDLLDGVGPANNHPARAALNETVTELGHSMTLPPEGDLLVEPLYALTGSHPLAYWALSLVARETHDDPLAPALRLWQAGVTLRFEGDGPIRAMAYRQRTR